MSKKQLPEGWYIRGCKNLYDLLTRIDSSVWGNEPDLFYFENSFGDWVYETEFTNTRTTEISVADYLTWKNQEQLDIYNVGDMD